MQLLLKAQKELLIAVPEALVILLPPVLETPDVQDLACLRAAQEIYLKYVSYIIVHNNYGSSC